MSTDDLIALFEKYHDNGEYLEFDRVIGKRSQRSDIHALLLLDTLVPDSRCRILAGASHDEVFLEPSLEDLAKVITEAQVLELVRSGVLLDDYRDDLKMNV